VSFAALKGYVMDSIGDESIGVREHGFEKYGAEGLIASSVDFGWAGLSAELRAHDRGVITKSTKAETEVCVAICPRNSLVTRLIGGVVDRTLAERGTIWLSPPGSKEVLVDIAAPLPQMLHMYLPARHFSAESLGIDVGYSVRESLRYRSFQDPLLAEIAFAIVSEMRTQTAGGRLLAEALAVSLAARLVHSHSSLSPDKDLEQLSHRGLDRRRLIRVREYIDANLEGGNLTIARLANVASLSQFHFARAFKAAVGNSPHQYVSAHRLERAKELLTRGDQSLLDIAIALNFSSQANFTRAFRKGAGMTPGQYRRGQRVEGPAH
jgi:AraC family transcriptional regulator